MNNSILDDIDKSSSRDISTFYSFNGDKSTYVFFVSDSKNIYIETHRGAIIIPYENIAKYNKLYAYYIISQQITSRQPKIYYCNTGYKGIYKEHRNWYIMSNIYWKSMNMSYGDYCYFKDNPNNIDLYNCNTIEDIASFIIGFNDSEQDPSKISDWLINYEITSIYNELYNCEVIINIAKGFYKLLEIIKRHFGINNDIVLKIFNYINIS
jgi:hypothetical protein